MKIIIQILAWMIVLILASTALATTEGKTPSEVVQTYCDADYKGERMRSPRKEDIIDKIVSWYETQERDEPGWDSFYVISGYRVGKTYTSGNKTIVEVEYEIEGINSYPHFERFDLTAIERFHLVKVNNEWRVDDIINLPRISIETAIRHYEELVQSYSKQGNTKELSLVRDKLLRVKDIQQTRILWPRKVESIRNEELIDT